MFNYNILERYPKTQVILEGEMDIEATEIMEQKITPELLNFTDIVIDFSRVSFVDSSGIGLMITMIQNLKEKGIRIVINRIKPDVQEVFSLLQLSDIVGIDVFAE